MSKSLKNRYDIAVIHGDGIGPEVCQSAVDVLKALFGDSDLLAFTEYKGGARTFVERGAALPKETLVPFEIQMPPFVALSAIRRSPFPTAPKPGKTSV